MANVKPIELDDSIRVRLSKDEKDVFKAICKNKAINSSK